MKRWLLPVLGMLAGVVQTHARPVVAQPPAEIDLDADRFFGERDVPRRGALLRSPITRIEPGRGGRTLAFRITLTGGVSGYYKPEQTASSARFYAELAAYYLDRELGFGRAPPSIGRSFRWEQLRRVAGADPRVSEVVVQDNGTVKGAFIWWIPERLPKLELGRGFERWFRIEPPPEVTPYQRPPFYGRAMQREERRQAAIGRGEEPPPRYQSRSEPDFGEAGDPDTPDRAAELSDLIVFDYLIGNMDRWGGGFVNVRTRGERGPLVFLDQGAAFLLEPNALLDLRMQTVQRFRRSTIEAVRRFDVARWERRMRGDPMAPLLGRRQIEAVMERRRQLVEHVAALQRRHGDLIWF